MGSFLPLHEFMITFAAFLFIRTYTPHFLLFAHIKNLKLRISDCNFLKALHTLCLLLFLAAMFLELNILVLGKNIVSDKMCFF